ncbi:hypothetical protein RSOLAG1IB_09669 [Rhizoctonia solani AG-1 IB]|uniref:DUF6534 domain-containing protein n=1 Tax=Thanatephorus cucumeris (strain AG1-IB / isolate 7/3/14) TaxID=1108050 RepID=A0A0B7FR58_THACB|nr:hypothetical protein RSOLAG1IB_09669 [Rhizoctonia solani AG-1 IB]
MQLGFGITLSSLAWVYWDIREIDEHLWVAIAWMGSATVSSVIITYNLSALLVSVYVPVQGAIDLISGLLRYLVHTGFLTSILTLVNLLGFFFTGQYVRIAVNFPLGTLHIIVILAILNARPNDATNSSTIEEYEFGTTRRKAESIDDLGQVALKGSLRIGKLSIKIPSRLLRKEPPITVLVQQDTHVIGISVIEDDNQNPSLRQHEDSDETESIETSVGLAKSHTPTI